MWNTLKKSLNSPDSYVSLALGFAVVLVVGMIAYNYFKAKTQPAAQTGTETEQSSSAAMALPAKHTVKAGETLWSISQNYYKSGYNWVDVQKANNLTNADRIEVGTVLTVPDVKPITASNEVPTAQTAQKREYTVVAGDSLWKIAVAQYQNGYRWPEIAKANKLANPNLIYTGSVLVLP